jgi:hypothetical protein
MAPFPRYSRVRLCGLVFSSFLMLGFLIHRAAGATNGDFQYWVNEGSVEITGYIGESEDLDIPETIQGLPVTKIGNSAFQGNTDLIRVRVPESVTVLSEAVFRGCTNLRRAILPSKPEVVAPYMFSGCVALEEVTLPKQVLELGREAFSGCKSLALLSLPPSLKLISESVFRDCTGLERVSIPAGVRKIDRTAFAGCAALSEIDVDVENPEYATAQGALYTHDFSTLLRCPPGRAGDFVMPSSADSIAAGAFTNCARLVTITLSDRIWRLDYGSFLGCSTLRRVWVGKGMIGISTGAFLDCPSLQSIEVDSLNQSYSSEDGVLFDKKKSLLLQYPIWNAGRYVVPDTVQIIRFEAFMGNTNLVAVKFGRDLAGIGSSAFEGCNRLREVQWNDRLTNIQRYAFAGCSSLTQLVLPSTLASIREHAFLDCSGVQQVVLGDGIRQIEGFAFVGCSSLTNVHFADGLQRIGMNAFMGCGGLVNLDLPDSVVSIEPMAFTNCFGLQAIDLGDRLPFIPRYCFAGCRSLRTVRIGASVTNIDVAAFLQCSNLALVEFPSGLQAIQSAAFLGCVRLRTAILPDGLSLIEYEAFSGCHSLSDLKLPKHLYRIGSMAFFQCAGTEVLLLPDSLEIVGGDAFAGWHRLRRVQIPALTSLSAEAFDDCPAIEAFEVHSENRFLYDRNGVLFDANGTTLLRYPPAKAGSYEVPEGIVNLGLNAFRDSKKLEAITLSESLEGMSARAFENCKLLKTVRLPTALRYVPSDAFAGCEALSRFEVSPANPFVSELDGVVFNYTGADLLLFPPGRAGVYLVPDKVQLISRGAFRGCQFLEGVVARGMLTHVGYESFSDCPKLSSVQLSSTLGYVEGNAWANCPRLTEVVFFGRPPQGEVPFSIFDGSPFVTVFHPAETSGWGSTFSGRPTAIWTPVPIYSEWVGSSGLVDRYPTASGEQDDADGDGLNNWSEMLAGTDAADPASVLTLELIPRPQDLSPEDVVPPPFGQNAFYFRSSPGRRYAIEQMLSLERSSRLVDVRVAGARQTRVLVPNPTSQAYYFVRALP